jgi:hypothetical protein
MSALTSPQAHPRGRSCDNRIVVVTPTEVAAARFTCTRQPDVCTGRAEDFECGMEMDPRGSAAHEEGTCSGPSTSLLPCRRAEEFEVPERL